MTTSANKPENTPPPAEAETDAPAGALAPPTVEALEQEIAGLQAEIAELKDRFLRAKAESDNVRRRAEAEVVSAHKYAIEQFAGELLAVRDSLDLAQGVELKAGEAQAIEKMQEGLALTLKLMDGVFQKFGMTRLDPQGEKFDPARHQAISMVESEQVPAGHVVNVVQKGYLIKDRLLRPAMVVVAKARDGG